MNCRIASSIWSAARSISGVGGVTVWGATAHKLGGDDLEPDTVLAIIDALRHPEPLARPRPDASRTAASLRHPTRVRRPAGNASAASSSPTTIASATSAASTVPTLSTTWWAKSRGGTDAVWNLRACHVACNSRKNALELQAETLTLGIRCTTCTPTPTPTRRATRPRRRLTCRLVMDLQRGRRLHRASIARSSAIARVRSVVAVVVGDSRSTRVPLGRVRSGVRSPLFKALLRGPRPPVGDACRDYSTASEFSQRWSWGRCLRQDVEPRLAPRRRVKRQTRA